MSTPLPAWSTPQGLIAWTVAALLTLLATPATAGTDTACGVHAARWVDACPALSPAKLTDTLCPPGAVVLTFTARDGARLELEITRARPHSFRRAGPLGVSPVGEFADWSSEPDGVRAILDGVTACAEERPQILLDGSGGEVSAPRPAPRPPWLVLAAFLATSALCFRARRDPSQKRVLSWVALVGAWAAGVGFRALVYPWSFFHQNGQAPIWIESALEGGVDRSLYGGGYGALYAWAAAADLDDPDRALFIANAVVGGAAVPLCWLLARAVGARPVFASALAAIVALDPVLARTAQSESHFTLSTVLLLAAAAILSMAARRPRMSGTLLGALAAGCLIAQALRVHPLAWVAGGLTPLVVVLQRGRLLTRLRVLGVAYAVTALVAAAASGSVLFEVLHGDISRRVAAEWSPTVAAVVTVFADWRTAAVLLPSAATALVLRRRRAWLPLVVAAVGLSCLGLANLAAVDDDWIHAAYYRQALGLWVASIVAWTVAAGIQRWALAPTISAAIVALASPGLGPWLSSDAREATRALEWRTRLPRESTVVYLSRTRYRVVRLPLYGRGVVGGIRSHPFAASRPPDLTELRGPVYYYRSTLCSTEEGRPVCAKYEKRFDLEEVGRWVLPAVPSRSDYTYDTNEVVVSLNRLQTVAPPDG